MNSHVIELTIGLLAVVTSAPVAHAQQIKPGELTPPPARLDTGDKRAVAVQVSHEDVTGSVDYDMVGKSVLFHWARDFSAYLPETQSPPHLSMEGWFVSSQSVSVPYWPTEVCWFGENKICVAGKTQAGKTRIQLWTLDSSEPLGEAYEDELGKTHYPETTIPVASMTTLYEGNQAGRRLVRLMFANLGDPQKLFVQFDDNRDLVQFDLSTGSFTLILSTAQEPMLLGIKDRWNANHQLGYMYDFSGTGRTGILLLFDTDRNGTLDLAATRHLVGDQWYAGPVDFSALDGYIARY